MKIENRLIAKDGNAWRRQWQGIQRKGAKTQGRKDSACRQCSGGLRPSQKCGGHRRNKLGNRTNGARTAATRRALASLRLGVRTVHGMRRLGAPRTEDSDVRFRRRDADGCDREVRTTEGWPACLRAGRAPQTEDLGGGLGLKLVYYGNHLSVEAGGERCV